MPDRRPDPELERMLDGGPLPAALAPLRSPAHPAELRGEEAALAAFRAARAPAPGRRARVVGRAVVVKVAVAGAVLAGGGLAVAAATGTLPGPAPTRPATTDQRAPGRPGGVVHQDRPTGVPQPPAPPPTSAPPTPTPPTPGNGNAWGHGHGSGKPSKPPKPPKPSKKPKDPKVEGSPPEQP